MSQGESANFGAIEKLQKPEEIPFAFLEGILEGLAKDPVRYTGVAIGFYLGYQGYDVLTWLMSRFKISKMASAAPDNPVEFMTAAALGPVSFIPGVVDVATVLMYPWTFPLGKAFDMSKTLKEHRDALKQTTPFKELDAKAVLDAWVSTASVSPVGTIQSIMDVALELRDQLTAATEDTVSQRAVDAYEVLRRRILMGMFGAFAAILLTTPGFWTGIGEIVKGVGEIVPG